MPEKILYYLGAGASALALPLAKSVWGTNPRTAQGAPAIPGLAFALKKIDLDKIFEAFQEKKIQDYKIKLKHDFLNLSEKADEFGDVDTYAKYLYLKGAPEFSNVKRIISQFFSLKQNFSGTIDKRYLPWLIGIMDNNRFPDNIKILSWNYDFQVQLASSDFGNLEDINHRQSSFTYSPPFIKHYPSLDPTPDRNDQYSLIHLNGIAGFSIPKDFHTSSVFQSSIKKSNKEMLDFLIDESNEPQIHFAWEKLKRNDSVMEKAAQMVKETTIIVVVGYSFPFFNRGFDKKIFENLMSSGSVRKIYYQDPVLDGEQLRAQFSLEPDLPIVHIKSVENFHIPFEL